MVITFLHKICLLQNYFTTEKVTMDFLLVQFDFTMSQKTINFTGYGMFLRLEQYDMETNEIKRKEMKRNMRK